MNNIYDCSAKKYDPVKIGKRITQRRKEKGYKHLDSFANAINVSRQTVSKWEKGDDTSKPTLYDFLRICNVLECELGYILCEYDELTRPMTDITAETGLTAEAVTKIQNINSTTRHNILNRLLESEAFKQAVLEIQAAVNVYSSPEMSVKQSTIPTLIKTLFGEDIECKVYSAEPVLSLQKNDSVDSLLSALFQNSENYAVMSKQQVSEHHKIMAKDYFSHAIDEII